MRTAPVYAILLAAGLAAGASSAAELPVINGQPAVASIDGAPISLRDLQGEIALLHAGQQQVGSRVARQNPSALLERLITARLIAQEARKIGLNELPEGIDADARMRLELMRDMLTDRAIKGIDRPDPATVEQLYRDAVKEYRVRSIYIRGEADAKALAAKLGSGGDFDALATALVKAKKAEADDTGQFLNPNHLVPHVASTLSKMKVGQVSPVLSNGAGWSVFKLLELRYPEGRKDARARAEAEALEQKRNDTWTKFLDGVRTRLVRVDGALLKQLDFDKDFEKLKSDKRPIATIKGEKPVTVADLSAALTRRFYHGVDKALSVARVNKEKTKVLEDVVNKRAIAAEAVRVGIPATPEFKTALARRQEGWLFDMFIQRAVLPDIKVTDADLAAYYNAHKADFTGPEMLKIQALAFTGRTEAQDAQQKLQRGADYAWLKSNARGQADPAKQELAEFPPGLIVVDALPAGVRKALAGAREGDVRFYGEGSGPYYVLQVAGYAPPQPVPLESVKDTIRKTVTGEKLAKSVEDWGAKLRKAANVKVYASGDELLKLVMRDMAAGS